MLAHLPKPGMMAAPASIDFAARGTRLNQPRVTSCLCAALAVAIGMALASPARAVTLSTIPATGFDADVVFESGLASGATGANTEIGTRQFFEDGATSPTDVGLPRTLPAYAAPSGNTINFAFQPFEQNNILKFTNGTAAKNLTLTTAVPYTQLAVIHSGGSIATNTEYGLLSWRINYVGGGTQTGVINTPDWGGPTTMPPGTSRIFAADRNTAGSNTWPITAEGTATATRWGLFVSEITPSQPTTAIQSITFGPNSLYTIATMTTGALQSGDDIAVFGLAGAAAPSATTLSLVVNKLSGVVTIKNPTIGPVDLKGYEITSSAGSLNLASWSSLSDRNVSPVDGPDGDAIVGNTDGETWDEAAGATSGAVQEGFLFGATTIPAGGSLPLGAVYNTAMPGDLAFQYRPASGGVPTGPVNYVNKLPPDFDQSSSVNTLDLLYITTGFGSTQADDTSGDADGDADVDANDFLMWQRYLGVTPPPASDTAIPTPEPASATLLGLVAASLASVSRMKRSGRRGGAIVASAVACVAVLATAPPGVARAQQQSPPPADAASSDAAPADNATATHDEDAVARAAIAAAEAPDGWWTRSMASREQRLVWWRQARFGCFMHWGVYSVLGGEYEGQPVRGYAEHIQRIRKIDQATYRRVAVEKFNPVGFNADEWADAAGAGRHAVPHHHLEASRRLRDVRFRREPVQRGRRHAVCPRSHARAARRLPPPRHPLRLLLLTGVRLGRGRRAPATTGSSPTLAATSCSAAASGGAKCPSAWPASAKSTSTPSRSRRSRSCSPNTTRTSSGSTRRASCPSPKTCGFCRPFAKPTPTWW